MGIFYPELKKIDEIGTDRVVCLSEQEANEKLKKKDSVLKAAPKQETLDLFNTLINMPAVVKEDVWGKPVAI